MAADSAVMVIDSSKGVEDQTKKLFKVCKMRGIPIFTFINKMDRSGKDPFELMEDIEKVLGIRSYPMNWPIGEGKNFKGVYNREKKQIEAFNDGNHGQSIAKAVRGDISDEKFSSLLGSDLHEKLLNDIELLEIAGDDFDLDHILNGNLTPVFFGSALTNFGVEPFLESFLDITTPPKPRESNLGEIDPKSNNFSGFIFKIQANMNPAHRDRIAFLRICSGKFEKGMQVNHVQKNKKVRLSQPQQFLAQDRVIVDTAYPGDIIGIHDPGIFNIGDTLCEDDSSLQYKDIPQFAPEHFAKIYTKNSLKRKQFLKGIDQLAEEGFNRSIEMTDQAANLFYYDEEYRERILLEYNEGKQQFIGKNGTLRFSCAELLQIASEFPWKLSNNVVTRPITQEMLFPTLAFIAGPGEIAYWAELKQVFEHFSIKMPLIVPRLNITLLDRAIESDFEELGLSLEEVLTNGTGKQQDVYLESVKDLELEKLFRYTKKQLLESYGMIQQKLDKGLIPLFEKNQARLLEQIEFMEGKNEDYLKQKHEVALSKFYRVDHSLRPIGAPQERILNALNYMNRYGIPFLSELAHLNYEFDGKHKVIKI